MLTPTPAKLRLLEACGLDAVLLLPFTRDLSLLTPEERAEERSRKEPTRPRKERKRKPKVDVSGLPFKTQVTEDEMRRDGNPYEAPELWTDL